MLGSIVLHLTSIAWLAMFRIRAILRWKWLAHPHPCPSPSRGRGSELSPFPCCQERRNSGAVLHPDPGALVLAEGLLALRGNGAGVLLAVKIFIVKCEARAAVG